MPRIRVTRYVRPINGWLGTVEPHNRAWILYVNVDESARLFLLRDSKTGGVRPPS
jgi:hypothetical protein